MATTDDERQRRNWTRRAKAAIEGRHLPDIAELLRGMPFLADDLARDAATWAERVAPRIDARFISLAEVRRSIEALTVSAQASDFIDAIQNIEEALANHSDLAALDDALKI